MTTHFLEIDKDAPDKIRLQNWDKRFKHVYNSIPTAKYHIKGDYWNFNLTWQTCLALKTTLKTIDVGEKLTEWTNETYSTRILPAYNLRTVREADGYPNLFPHQRADVQFLSTARRAILANGLGSGKSQSSFSTIRYLYEQGEQVFPVFIACPNSTKLSWAREIDKVWPGLDISVVSGSAAKRRKLLETPAHVYIMNWESIRSHSRLKPFGSVAAKKCTECGGHDPKTSANACEVHIKELNNIEFKSVIGDEIHRIKDPSSKTARAFKAATGDAEFRFGLSGTPIASTPYDLYSPLNWLFPESYPSKSKYLDRFCDVTENNWGGKIVLGIKEHMKQEYFAGLDPFLRRMPKELILEFLPPVSYERRDVEMGVKQKKAYEQMRDQMIAELDGGDVITSTSPLTKMTRMLQFAAAFGTVDYVDEIDELTGRVVPKPRLTLSDPSCKVDAFMDDLEDFDGESVVVFAESRQLINLLSARMEKAGISHGLIVGGQDDEERQYHMDRFQEGDIKYILCTIKAGGTGITLTAGSVAVFLQRSWSMIDNLQAEGRVHRIGSEIHDFVRVVDYVSKDTVEDSVFEALTSKSDQLETILRDQELMKKYLLGVK